MNFKRPVLMSALWLPALLFAVWLLFAALPRRQSPPNAPRAVAETQAVAPPSAAKPQTPLLPREKELVGKYHMGSHWNINCVLTLTADHRFTFVWMFDIIVCDSKGNCKPYVFDSNTGAWERQGDVVVMRPEKPNLRDGGGGMATRLVPVTWGKRHYLADENQMPAFAVAARNSARRKPGADDDGLNSICYTQMKDGKPVSTPGKSLLPARYIDYYRQGPVTAKVARIDRQGRAVLNVSAPNRVTAGMLFTVIYPSDVDLKVLSVKGREAVCKILYRWNSEERVKAGADCTTGTEHDAPAGIGLSAYDAPPKAGGSAMK